MCAYHDKPEESHAVDVPKVCLHSKRTTQGEPHRLFSQQAVKWQRKALLVHTMHFSSTGASRKHTPDGTTAVCMPCCVGLCAGTTCTCTYQSKQGAEDATAQHANSEEYPQVSPVPQVSSKKHPNCICCQERQVDLTQQRLHRQRHKARVVSSTINAASSVKQQLLPPPQHH